MGVAVRPSAKASSFARSLTAISKPRAARATTIPAPVQPTPPVSIATLPAEFKSDIGAPVNVASEIANGVQPYADAMRPDPR